ncbi:MAG: DUF115 domain-containing protein [Thermoplasmata archaeon]|nr:DUF115 domain-containing protein [Thermoplasmata archaeon]
MNWEQWKHWYAQIVENLGLEPEEDTRAAELLLELEGHRGGEPELLDKLIRGKDVMIFGPAPFTNMDFGDVVKISAGSTTDQLVDKNIWPEIIVTDLDGDVPAQVEANKKGAIAIIHAHGDNFEAIKEWVPSFSPPVIGTTQAEPFPGIYNFGGFTDGDRAVFMAIHFGARKIILKGFDYDNPMGKPIIDMELKLKKLGYAKQLITWAEKTFDADIVYAED